VHHSDRGSQYANDYTDLLLKANQIDISMSRKGNPWDNAACESFMKTLKYEEVLRNVPGPGRGPSLDLRVPGKGLQPEAPALGPRLHAEKLEGSSAMKELISSGQKPSRFVIDSHTLRVQSGVNTADQVPDLSHSPRDIAL
jgi:transposase InsO family protein